MDLATVDPELAEPAVDAVVAPRIKIATIFRKPLRVPSIVEVSELRQLVDRCLGGGLIDLGLLKTRPHFGHRAVALGNEAICALQRVIKTLSLAQIGHGVA